MSNTSVSRFRAVAARPADEYAEFGSEPFPLRALVDVDRDELVRRCIRRGVDIETLHVDVCTALDLFGGAAKASPGANETTQAIQIPVYESLTDAELERVASVVRGAVESVSMAEIAGESRSA